MLYSCFQVLLTVLKRCTSPFLLVFLPPIRIISLFEIASALHAHKGFYTFVKKTTTYSHSYLVNKPVVFLNFENFNGVVDFLLGTSEKAAKRVNKLIVDSARWQVVTFVFHRGSLDPFVLCHDVLLHWVQTLLAAKASQDKHVTFTKSYRVGISRLAHRLLGYDFILSKHVDPGILLRWGAASSNQDLEWW